MALDMDFRAEVLCFAATCGDGSKQPLVMESAGAGGIQGEGGGGGGGGSDALVPLGPLGAACGKSAA